MRKQSDAMQEDMPKEKTVPVRKSTLILLFCLCGVLAVGTGLGIYRNYAGNTEYRELRQLAATVKQNYYTDVDDEAVMQGAMKGYVAGLDDPYSQYMTSEEYQAYQTEEAGQTVGIGVTVTQTDEGYLQVEEVNADSPAEKAGMQQGDTLTKVEGEDLAELGYAGALSKIRGEAGTTVQLTIQRNGDTLELDVERQNIEVTTAEGQMLDGQIGYIRISSFKGNTPEQFQAIYDRLVQDGAKALIFDLRDDGGGLVSALEKILDPLLSEGEIAIATYRDGTTKTLVESDATECSLPMTVIVNGNTASAAELFTASLRDFGKASVVGTQTFGKGIMQVTQSMPSGGALTLTVATYQTTKGECYHKVGIKPDEIVEAGEDAVDYSDPNPEKDPQLKKAIEMVQAK